jgi:YD repeat-containing protein
MTSPAGTTKYHYDTLTGRLDEIESPQGKKFRYTYNHGQVQTLEYPNGITANYAFDPNGMPIEFSANVPGLDVRRQDHGKFSLRRSVLDTPLQIGQKKYERGLGTHAVSDSPDIVSSILQAVEEAE